MTDLYIHTAKTLIERAQDMEAIRSARDEADRANRAMSRFLSTASHDVRQPLQTLSLLNGTLGRLVVSEHAAAVVKEQQQAITTMSSLVNALLDIGKLQSGGIKPSVSEFKLAPLFAELRTEFSKTATEKGLRLEIVVSPESVVSDRVLLGQMLRNLLGNAIRYTHEGCVRLECQSDRKKLRVDVTDTGIGIPEDKLEDIFEEFYQVGVSPNSTREGHGLGLSIVQRAARLLEHELQVSSQLGRGSVFSIWVPLGKSTKSHILQQTGLSNA